MLDELVEAMNQAEVDALDDATDLVIGGRGVLIGGWQRTTDRRTPLEEHNEGLPEEGDEMEVEETNLQLYYR